MSDESNRRQSSDGAGPARGALYASRLALGAALVLMALGAFHFVNLTFDDAFISFRYAENLAEGHGLVFNPGERVEGYSNFLWTVFMAVPALFGVGRHELGMLVFAKVVGVLLGLATLLVTLRAATLGTSERDRVWAPVAPLYLALSSPFLVWSVGALETPLVTLLLALVAYLHLREDLESTPSHSAVPWSYGVLLLAGLSRPEPVVFLVPLAVLRALRSFRREPCRRGSGPRTLAREARFASLFLVGYALFIVWRYAYYGELVPNTYFAKVHQDPRTTVRGSYYLDAALDDMGWLPLAALAFGAMLAARHFTYRALLALSLVGTQIAVVVWEGGDWMPGYRMLVPILPSVGLLVFEGWVACTKLGLERLSPQGSVPAWLAPPGWVSAWGKRVTTLGAARHARSLTALARVIACAALALALTNGAVRSFRAIRVAGLESGFRRLHLDAPLHFPIARWMQREIHDSGLLALGEAGIVPYYTKLPVLDMFGLMDRHIAHQRGSMHHKLDVNYVFERRPKYVLLLVNRAPDGRITSNHAYAEVLLGDARFSEQYQPLHDFDGAILYVRRAGATPSAP